MRIAAVTSENPAADEWRIRIHVNKFSSASVGEGFGTIWFGSNKPYVAEPWKLRRCPIKKRFEFGACS
jgi:hypothetical protein